MKKITAKKNPSSTKRHNKSQKGAGRGSILSERKSSVTQAPFFQNSGYFTSYSTNDNNNDDDVQIASSRPERGRRRRRREKTSSNESLDDDDLNEVIPNDVMRRGTVLSPTSGNEELMTADEEEEDQVCIGVRPVTNIGRKQSIDNQTNRSSPPTYKNINTNRQTCENVVEDEQQQERQNPDYNLKSSWYPSPRVTEGSPAQKSLPPKPGNDWADFLSLSRYSLPKRSSGKPINTLTGKQNIQHAFTSLSYNDLQELQGHDNDDNDMKKTTLPSKTQRRSGRSGDFEDDEEDHNGGKDNNGDNNDDEDDSNGDEIIREKKVKSSSRLPNLGTNIDDIRRLTDFHQYGKRFNIVGLNYECYTFKTLKQLIQHIAAESSNKDLSSLDQKESALHSRPRALKFDDPVWIDIQNPSIADMKMIEKYFGLHPLTTEDIINLDTGEKWELFTEYMFVVFTGQVDDEIPPPTSSFSSKIMRHNQHQPSNETQLNILVFHDYVITIHDRPIKGLDLLMRRIETEFEFDINHNIDDNNKSLTEKFPALKNVPSITSTQTPTRNTWMHSSSTSFDDHIDNEASLQHPILQSRCAQFAEPPSSMPPVVDVSSKLCKRTHIPSSDWVLYAFLDAMVDMYIPFVDSLVLEVDNLDELVFILSQNEQNDLLKRLGLAKRNVVTLRRLLLPKQKMTTYLASQPIRFLSHTVQLYLRDVLDHLQICLEKLEVARENLNQTHNNYLTKVQIEIAEASGRTDAFMNRITVIASLLGPLTLISSIWGMNVKVPGQDEDNLWWFFGICAGMIIIALVLAILLRNKLISK